MAEVNKIVEAAINLLPRNGVNKSGIHPVSQDVENASPLAEPTDFDPFKKRDIDNGTTDCQTLTHLMKSTLGSGIMAMPAAFRASGVAGGVLGGLCLAAISTHTSYILVQCAHKLYVKARKTKMDYEDVVETAFANGPHWGRKYAKHVRKCVLVWLFSTYFGACVTDNILIAKNYYQVIDYHTRNATVLGNASIVNATSIDEYSPLRPIMGYLIIPLVLFIWVPDLKYLAPISTLANFLMAGVIGITCYYLVQDLKPMSELHLFQPITRAPEFFSTTLFAMANIGVIMPLENNMKSPQHFLGTCGVLNIGMFSITFVYLLLGALGYSKYGDKVESIITMNLPINETPAQVVKILIGTTVLLTFSLQFYVCREMVWTRVEKYFPKRPRLAEYVIRALLVIACVSIAIAVPMIGPLIALVGALGFSLLGIVCPVVIELVTYWDIGYGRLRWRLYKNAFLIVFGLTCLVSGSHSAIKEIVNALG